MTAAKIPEAAGPGARSADLARDLRGEGAPTVQLHGLTSSRRRDEVLGLDLTRDLPGLRTLRYDARGHGRSAGAREPEAYRWPELAADLLDLLDAEFPGRAVHGVGQSMGAATLLCAAAVRPERFASLTLVLPPTVWAWRVPQSEAYLASAAIVERDGVETFAEAGRGQPLPPAVDPGRPFTLPDVEAALLPSVFRGAAASDLPDESVVAGIGVPALVLAWIDDAAHPAAVADRLAELLPDVRSDRARTPDDVARWPGLIDGFTAATA